MLDSGCRHFSSYSKTLGFWNYSIPSRNLLPDTCLLHYLSFRKTGTLILIILFLNDSIIDLLSYWSFMALRLCGSKRSHLCVSLCLCSKQIFQTRLREPRQTPFLSFVFLLVF